MINMSDFRIGTLKVSGQLNMGGLLKALESVDQALPVRIDGYPDRIPYADDVGSYRGYYEDLAIPYASDAKPVTVATFAAALRASIGETFDGYKGGDYVCSARTAVWLANYGRTMGAAVTGVVERDGDAVLTWATDEDDTSEWDEAKKGGSQ